MTYAFSHEGKKKPSLGVDLLAMVTLMAGAEWVGVCSTTILLACVRRVAVVRRRKFFVNHKENGSETGVVKNATKSSRR